MPERPNSNPPISDTSLLLEWKYSDDTDFLDEERETLYARPLPVCKDVFQEWNLFVNEDKKEFVHFHVAGIGDTDADGNFLLGNEPWRFL